MSLSLLQTRARRNHSGSGVTYESAVMADNPLAYWKADDAPGSTVMLDSSGNGYNATYNTAAAGLVLGTGPLRRGATASAKMTALGWAARINNAALNVWNTTTWGVEFIAAVTGGGSVGRKIIGTDGTISSFGSFSNQWRTDQLQNTNGGTFRLGSPNKRLNRIDHYFLERNGAVMTLYENGVPVATGASGGGAGEIIFMGTFSYPTSYSLLGYASDFAFYDHVIGPERIAAHVEAADIQNNALKAYRLYVTANNGATDWFVGIGELEFRVDGQLPLFHGSSPFASSTYSGYTPSAAFDGNKAATGSNDCWPSASGSISPQFVGCWLSSATPVNSVSIWSRFLAAGQGPTHAPKDFKIQSSTDTTTGLNGTWVDEWSVTGQTGWGYGEGRTFNRP